LDYLGLWLRVSENCERDSWFEEESGKEKKKKKLPPRGRRERLVF